MPVLPTNDLQLQISLHQDHETPQWTLTSTYNSLFVVQPSGMQNKTQNYLWESQ